MVRYNAGTADDHPLEVDLPVVEGEDAGITGGMTDDAREAEEARVAAAPQTTGAEVDLTYNVVVDPNNHEMPTGGLHRMEYPRHDAYASENTGVVPDRIIPSTPTGANPTILAERGIASPGPVSTADMDGDGEQDEPAVQEPQPQVPPVPPTPKGEEGPDPEQPAMTPAEQPATDPDGTPPADADTGDEAEPAAEPAAEPDPAEPALEDTQELEMPAGNASTEAWREFAIAEGMTAEQANSMSRDELRDHYWTDEA